MDAFVGNYEMESRENLDAFLKGIGVPEQYQETAKNATLKTEIKADGDVITITRIRPQKTNVHTFKLGEASEVETPKGEKINVTVTLDGGKLVAKGDEYNISTEIADGKLKEILTLRGHTMTRFSAKK